MEIFAILPFLLVAIIAVAAIGIGMYMQAQRREALQNWGMQHGMRFNPTKDHGLNNRFSYFKCLQRGHSRYGNNFLSGKWNGFDYLSFDYHYTTGSGKHRQHHCFSCVILSSNLLLKSLAIRPEGFFDKVGDFFGYGDIDFESAEFSDRFHVASPDRRWAYDVLHTRAMEYLLNRNNYSIYFDANCALVHLGSRRFDGPEFGMAADHLGGFLTLLPDYVIQQQRGHS